MIKIRVDLTEFKAAMSKNKANIPKATKEITRDIAVVVLRGAKQQLYPGHGLIKGDLKRSIRITPGRNIMSIAPHVVYAGWIEEGGTHPRWGVPTNFFGYGYMKIGAMKGQRQAKSVADKVMNKYFKD